MGSCRKKPYYTPTDAMLALVKIQHKRNLEGVEKHERSYYFCKQHKCYHLTSWKTTEG